MIGDLKHQFLELLASIGFVPANVNLRRRKHEDRVAYVTSKNVCAVFPRTLGPIPRIEKMHFFFLQLNVNGDNEKLLAAIICAALYPNLVKIFTPGRVYIQGSSGSIPKPCQAEELQFKTKLDGYVSDAIQQTD